MAAPGELRLGFICFPLFFRQLAIQFPLHPHPSRCFVKRRDFLASQVLLAGAAATAAKTCSAQTEPPTGGRVRQSVMGWCFKPIDPLTLAGHCKRIGLEAIEGIPASSYDAVTSVGLKISLVGSHGFATGPLDPDNHAEVESSFATQLIWRSNTRLPT